jgi:putative NADPH-quinone reductase
VGALFGALITWVLSRLFKRQSPEAQAASRAAEAETKLQYETEANADVQEAIQAARASDAAVLLHPDRLRDDDGFRRD